MREQRVIRPILVYKLSKVEEKTPNFEEKFGKICKDDLKKKASRATSK